MSEYEITRTELKCPKCGSTDITKVDKEYSVPADAKRKQGIGMLILVIGGIMFVFASLAGWFNHFLFTLASLIVIGVGFTMYNGYINAVKAAESKDPMMTISCDVCHNNFEIEKPDPSKEIITNIKTKKNMRNS